jgi:hypothetical protein
VIKPINSRMIYMKLGNPCAAIPATSPLVAMECCQPNDQRLVTKAISFRSHMHHPTDKYQYGNITYSDPYNIYIWTRPRFRS